MYVSANIKLNNITSHVHLYLIHVLYYSYTYHNNHQIMDTLNEHIKYANIVFNTVKSLDSNCPELLKLLGTIYLSTATLIGAMKSKAMPLLPNLLPVMVNVLGFAKDIVINAEDIWRGKTLLIRSVLSAITSIVSDLPSFIHPFVLSILNMCLQVHSSMEKDDVEIVYGEVDKCIGTIISNVPPRLLIPCLEKGVGSLLSISHTAARKTCELLGELWGYVM